MPTDPALLAEAQEKKRQLEAARRALSEARAGLSSALGRLRESGAEPDELTEALGVSPDELAALARGGWVSRNAPDAKESACSFCGRRQRDVSRLVAGPTRYICSECVVSLGTMLESRNAVASAPRATAVAPEDRERVCSFCGKERARVSEMAMGDSATICAECLALSAELIDPERTP